MSCGRSQVLSWALTGKGSLDSQASFCENTLQAHGSQQGDNLSPPPPSPILRTLTRLSTFVVVKTRGVLLTLNHSGMMLNTLHCPGKPFSSPRLIPNKEFPGPRYRVEKHCSRLFRTSMSILYLSCPWTSIGRKTKQYLRLFKSRFKHFFKSANLKNCS